MRSWLCIVWLLVVPGCARFVTGAATDGGPTDGRNSCDIFALRSPGTDSFGAPQRLPGALVNTSAFEGEPFISGDGCELFFVRGTASANWDLYRAELGP